jgi:hypothetical protein
MKVAHSHSRACAITFGLLLAMLVHSVPAASSLTLTNPILFVTQVPLPKEINGNVSNTFVSVVSLFGNHLADAAGLLQLFVPINSSSPKLFFRLKSP